VENRTGDSETHLTGYNPTSVAQRVYAWGASTLSTNQSFTISYTSGKFYSDTMFCKQVSIWNSYKCAQIYTDGHGFDFFYPMVGKSGKEVSQILLNSSMRMVYPKNKLPIVPKNSLRVKCKRCVTNITSQQYVVSNILAVLINLKDQRTKY
jgi:hypothetical protein